MTDPNGWPEKPGVPLNPERDAINALLDQIDRDLMAAPGARYLPYTDGRLREAVAWLKRCLTRAEVAAREQAAAVAMREKVQAEEQALARIIVAADLMQQATALGPDWAATMQAGLDRMGLSDALAAMLAQARREALEEAARIADDFTCGSCGMDGKAAAAIRAKAQEARDE